MPLIKGMKSTNIWKAFLLNSIASTLILFIALSVKEKFDTFKNKDNEEIIRTTSAKSIGFTLIATFCATMIAYTLMWIIFGFGGSMISSTK
jgi:hypothetical protein